MPTPRLLSPFVLTLLLLGLIGSGSLLAPEILPGPDDRPADGDYYIVQLEAAPLASYRGGLPGLAATSAQARDERRLDPESPASRAYLAYLAAELDRLEQRIAAATGRAPEVLHRYQYAFAGLAVWLSPGEAKRIEALPGVRRVEQRRVDRIDTDAGPSWIGAPQVWEAVGDDFAASRGEGVVVAILDTGINMDHPSFAEVAEDGYEHLNPLGRGTYLGWCDPEHERYDPELVCNDKLIGAYSYEETTQDPEDEDGHGSHTASTVAGNPIMEATLASSSIRITRSISGVAPRANILSFDVCNPGCPNTANVKAVDDAVKAGIVDVINRSIGLGGQSAWYESVQQAFLGAHEAGIFVANSAGNSTNPRTSNGDAPWMASVAASTHNRRWDNRLVDMQGGEGEPPEDMLGSGITGGYGPAPIVFAAGYANESGDPDDGQCLLPFPAGTFDGQIVVCDRGQIARVQKGAHVLAGGAGGYVLANTAAQGEGTSNDLHVLPGLHIGWQAAQLLHAWLAEGDGQVATITGSVLSEESINGDVLASFSSKGPAHMPQCCRRDRFYDNDDISLLKPDVTGPGVDVLAAQRSEDGVTPPEFGIMSGTSMSSPHVAGAGALVSGARPDWSPSQIQSALMLTAELEEVRKTDAETLADPFDVGAGSIRVQRAAGAGFTLSETADAFRAADPYAGGRVETLNLASLTHAQCLGRCSWQRRLTSSLERDVTWAATVVGFDGQPLTGAMRVTVEPSSFTLEAGASIDLEVTAELPPEQSADFHFARIDFVPAGADPVPAAHMPVVVRARQALLPDNLVIRTDQAMGDKTLEPLQVAGLPSVTLAVAGLAAAEVHTATLPIDPTPDEPFDVITGSLGITLTVPDGARRLVVELGPTAAKDLDLHVGRDNNGNGQPAANERRCLSGGAAADELCNLVDPEPGLWWIRVQSHEASSEGAEDIVTLLTSLVVEGDAGNLSATAPETVSDREPFALDLAWDLPGLMPGDAWYGLVDLLDDDGDRLGTVLIDLLGVEPGAVPTATPTPVPPTPVPTDTPQPPAGLLLPWLGNGMADEG